MSVVSVRADGFVHDGELFPLVSGSLHYWRHPRELWPALLDRVREMGFEMVQTYVPWAVHEPEPGRFDFGEQDPSKDIVAFLELCREKGLKALVRPGPHINAELPTFGYPRWVLEDPEVQARRCTGALCILISPSSFFPVPSYASEKFYQEVSRYFDALLPRLAPLQYPEGPIVGVQADNEMGYFFHMHAYALDYADDSVRLYQRMLEERYGSIDALNAAYGTSHRRFEDVDPPRDFQAARREELPFYLDWVRYKEFQLRWALDRIGKMLRQGGLDRVPIFHNYYGVVRVPFDITGTEENTVLDVVGVDFYMTRAAYEYVREGVRFMAGASKLPFSPEFGSGIWPYSIRFMLPGLMPEDEEFITLAAFMHGLKALNLYMLVERERWYGSPVTRDNRVRREYFDLYVRLNRFLRETGLLSLPKRVDLLLLHNRETDRLANAMSTLGGIDPGFPLPIPAAFLAPTTAPDLGYDPRYDNERWIAAFRTALSQAGIDYNCADTALPLERLSRYRLVLLPTFDSIDTATWDNLTAYVEGGGTLVVGPMLPRFDSDMRPHSFSPPRADNGSFHLLSQPEELSALLPRLLAPQEFSLDDATLDLSVHAGERRSLLFVANPTPEHRRARLAFDGRRRFVARWGGDNALAEGALENGVPPYSVQVWEVLDAG